MFFHAADHLFWTLPTRLTTYAVLVIPRDGKLWQMWQKLHLRGSHGRTSSSKKTGKYNRYSAIGRHLEQHGLLKTDLANKQFSVLKTCRSKFDFLIFEMLFIKEFNTESMEYSERLYSRQTLSVILRANTSLFAYFHVVLRVS